MGSSGGPRPKMSGWSGACNPVVLLFRGPTNGSTETSSEHQMTILGAVRLIDQCIPDHGIPLITSIIHGSSVSIA